MNRYEAAAEAAAEAEAIAAATGKPVITARQRKSSSKKRKTHTVEDVPVTAEEYAQLYSRE